MKSVYISNPGFQYINMMARAGYTLADSVKDASLVMFTGGADVVPSLYGDPPHPTTGSNLLRDVSDISVFREALALGKPMVGICRGGQFLNVMGGGSMIQDIAGHALGDTHPVIETRSGKQYPRSSTHHQMMNPHPQAAIVVAHSEGLAHEHSSELAPEWEGMDIEGVFYPHTKSLCFQPHPEFHGVPECRELFFHLLTTCLGA